MVLNSGFADDKAAPPAPAGAGLDSENEDLREDVNELVMSLLPWGVSILFHVGLVLLAIFIVWSVQRAGEEEDVIVPDARLSATPGAPLTQTVTKTVTKTTASTRSVTRSTQQSTSALTTATATNSSLIGALGASASSQSNPFQQAIETGAEFKTNFFGSGGNAKRIIYLVDASGSLIDTLPFVITELKRSISELTDRQQFTVIFFGEFGVGAAKKLALEAPPPGLKRADSENKDRVIQWIDPGAGNVIAKGRSTPIQALEIALRYKPQLMFILSDNITGSGVYEVDQRRLLADIKRANVGGTKINTIQFLYPDALSAVGLKPTLELISDDTGGRYKFLDARELNIE